MVVQTVGEQSVLETPLSVHRSFPCIKVRKKDAEGKEPLISIRKYFQMGERSGLDFVIQSSRSSAEQEPKLFEVKLHWMKRCTMVLSVLQIVVEPDSCGTPTWLE